MEEYKVELDKLKEYRVAPNNDIFAYLLSITENFDQVKEIKSSLELQGLEINFDMYKVLFDLAETYSDGKFILEQMEKEKSNIEPLYYNRLFWKQMNEEERKKATRFYKKIFKRVPDYHHDFDYPTMVAYEFMKIEECREKLRKDYTRDKFLTNIVETEERYQKQIERIKVSIQPLVVDKPKRVEITKFASRESIKRDRIIAKNAIVTARYLCDINPNHKFFNSEVTKQNYVEAHHLIPIEFQSDFNYSLDVEANIVSLCVVCHKKLHHAIFEQKKDLIKLLYDNRKGRLIKCRIGITLDELYDFYK